MRGEEFLTPESVGPLTIALSDLRPEVAIPDPALVDGLTLRISLPPRAVQGTTAPDGGTFAPPTSGPEVALRKVVPPASPSVLWHLDGLPLRACTPAELIQAAFAAAMEGLVAKDRQRQRRRELAAGARALLSWMIARSRRVASSVTLAAPVR